MSMGENSWELIFLLPNLGLRDSVGNKDIVMKGGTTLNS